jgi:hypothetical protein
MPENGHSRYRLPLSRRESNGEGEDPGQDPPKLQGRSGGFGMADLNEQLLGTYDRTATITRCAVDGCDWKHEGSAAEGRQAAAAHRAETHPELAARGRRRRRRPPRRVA